MSLRHASVSILAYAALGVAGLFIIASLTFFAELYPRNIIVLGIGVILLSPALVFLQLSYWREGEVRNSGRTEGVVRTVPQKVPSNLRNPQLRRVWENMEESRRLMELKEKEDREADWRREEERLRLSHDEEILFMEEPSWLAFLPLVLLSAVSLLISALTANPIVSFLCLALGLGGLLLLILLKGRTRYYLTSFRVLVRERFVLSGGARWTCLPYTEVQRFFLEDEFGRRRLRLDGSEESIRACRCQPFDRS